jgi:putative FmdB family regulatory protein
MPTYTYRCAACRNVWDEQRTVDERDKPKDGCPLCMMDATARIYQPTPTHFKGSGFYSTDKDK